MISTSEPPNPPPEVGVMRLPEVCLFPGELLPLYIFEPRYRAMLVETLGSHRMFAVTMSGGDRRQDVGGVGFVRACVQNADGTANLILQGLSRVRVLRNLRETPFPKIRIEPLESVNSEPADAKRLADEARDCCMVLKSIGVELPAKFEAALDQIGDPGLFCDLVASTLVAEAAMRQRLLEELDVSVRLATLVRCLKAAIKG